MDLYALAGIHDPFGHPALLPNTPSIDRMDQSANFQPLRSTLVPNPSLWSNQFRRKLPDPGPWVDAMSLGGIA